jgi:hypoxanthine phosphoribosyltransferase
MSSELVCVLSEKAITARVEELADEIHERLPGETITLLGVLKGAVIFLADLARAVGPGVELSFVRARSYGDRTTSSGKVLLGEVEEEVLRGHCVVVVDTILDTGHTLKAVVDRLHELEAKKVLTCVLLDKRTRRVVDVQADMVGFEVEDRFLVGYGLDIAGRHRSLRYVAAIEDAGGG